AERGGVVAAAGDADHLPSPGCSSDPRAAAGEGTPRRRAAQARDSSSTMARARSTMSISPHWSAAPAATVHLRAGAGTRSGSAEPAAHLAGGRAPTPRLGATALTQ